MPWQKSIDSIQAAKIAFDEKNYTGSIKSLIDAQEAMFEAWQTAKSCQITVEFSHERSGERETPIPQGSSDPVTVLPPS